MRKLFFYCLIFLSLTNCTKKEVQLPKIDVTGIPKINDHSSIWVFFKINQNDTIAEVNKNNRLINTHWILNIDKRLTMQKVVPVLKQMQKDKSKPSMHKKEGFHTYFSYADLTTNKMALELFNPTKYIDTERQLDSVYHSYKDRKKITIQLNKNKLTLSNEIVSIKELKTKLMANKLKMDSINTPIIFLKFSKETSFESYLKTKVYLAKTNFNFAPVEYIYNLK